MASRNRILGSSHRSPSPPLSAFRSSPLTNGLLPSYPLTSSPFPSSPGFSSTDTRSAHSPDLFEKFEYSSDMDADFKRIDAEGEKYQSSQSRSSTQSPPPISPDDQKTWVVFRGTVPGLYDYFEGAAIQTQGFSDAFQRAYPNRTLAEAAWIAYTQDGTYPDYGKSPWVVFLGRKPGVFERVTELECSIKGYAGAIFRPCSSLADGNIKFQLFAQQVARMFAGPDPFPTVDALVPSPARGNGLPEVPSIQPATTIPITHNYPPPHRVAESSKSPAKRNEAGPSSLLPTRRPKVPPPGDGWYVVYNGVHPGVCCGSKELKEAKPRPGGFLGMASEGSADKLFHHFAVNSMVIWASGGE